MGWKNVKDYYKIEHIVCVQKDTGDIQIGSPYICDIIVITKEGKFLKRYERDYDTTKARLQRYQTEMETDIPKLVELINDPDSFCTSKPVYSYDYETGKIVEDYCEEYKWPNCTHKGFLMYDNEWFEDKTACMEFAIRNLKSSVKICQEMIESHQMKVEENLNRKIRCENASYDLEILLEKTKTTKGEQNG